MVKPPSATLVSLQGTVVFEPAAFMVGMAAALVAQYADFSVAALLTAATLCGILLRAMLRVHEPGTATVNRPRFGRLNTPPLDMRAEMTAIAVALPAAGLVLFSHQEWQQACMGIAWSALAFRVANLLPVWKMRPIDS